MIAVKQGFYPVIRGMRTYNRQLILLRSIYLFLW